MEHHLSITPGEFDSLARGHKHFLIMRDTDPPLHFGDVLVFANRHLKAYELPLVRHVAFAEDGMGLAPNWVCVELNP